MFGDQSFFLRFDLQLEMAVVDRENRKRRRQFGLHKINAFVMFWDLRFFDIGDGEM